MERKALEEFFRRTPALAQLCTQNGWPDDDTLRLEVFDQQDGAVVCTVSFEEIVMEGAGCVAGRVACWGRFRVAFDGNGAITAVQREA